MRRSKGLTAAFAVLATLAGPTAASADTNLHFNAKVRVLAAADEYEYHGRVRSNVEECQVGRTVRVTRGGRLIGKTGTDIDGRFSFRAKPVPDGSTVKFKLKPNGPDCAPAKIFVEL